MEDVRSWAGTREHGFVPDGASEAWGLVAHWNRRRRAAGLDHKRALSMVAQSDFSLHARGDGGIRHLGADLDFVRRTDSRVRGDQTADSGGREMADVHIRG